VIGWRDEDTSERINCADTVKVQWSAAVSKGRVILSDMDGCCSRDRGHQRAHDILVGGSTPAAYGAASRNTQENLSPAPPRSAWRARHSPCVTFFAPVSLDENGCFVWNQDRKQPGDFVDLRAEMNAILCCRIARIRSIRASMPPPNRSCWSAIAFHSRGRRPLPDRIA